jgi:hypothetical protein
MDESEWTVQRLPCGAIDYAAYRRRAREARHVACKDILRALMRGRAFLFRPRVPRGKPG